MLCACQKHVGHHHSAAFTKWNVTICVSHKPPKREFNPEYLNLLDKRKKETEKGGKYREENSKKEMGKLEAETELLKR